ncbi:UDP-N-acetylglucosamine transferase [Trichinella spiralis]|uniref:UDP-N-acetylglucosamine transferase n=2 Tax=Trichinella spiralis TaxID=6334 RepID=A0ABR3KRE2_TRISP
MLFKCSHEIFIFESTADGSLNGKNDTSVVLFWLLLKKIFLWCTTCYTDVFANFVMKLTVPLLSAADMLED